MRVRRMQVGRVYEKAAKISGAESNDAYVAQSLEQDAPTPIISEHNLAHMSMAWTSKAQPRPSGMLSDHLCSLCPAPQGMKALLDGVCTWKRNAVPLCAASPRLHSIASPATSRPFVLDEFSGKVA